MILNKTFEKDKVQAFKAVDSNDFIVSLKKRKLDSLDDFYYSLNIYERNLNDKYLLIARDIILEYNDNIFSANIIKEYPISNLENEIKEKKK